MNSVRALMADLCCSVTQEGYLVVGAAVQEDSSDLA
jgi:hypothetical protein